MTKNDSEHNTPLKRTFYFFARVRCYPPPPTEADYNPAAARARVRTYVCMYGDAANRCQLPALMRRNPYESKTLRFHLLQAHYTFASIILGDDYLVYMYPVDGYKRAPLRDSRAVMHCAYERDDTNISQLNVKHSSIDVEGRLNTVTHHVADLPENCSVRDLELLMYDLLGVSPRQPVELRYFGKVLDSKKLLKDYAIRDPFMPMEHRKKDGRGYDAESHLRSYTQSLKTGVLGSSGGDLGLAEITVIVKPKLLKGCPVPGGDVPFKRVKLASNKLQQPLTLDGVSGETTVLELKQMVTALLKTKETRVFLAHAAVPADERIDTETCKSIDLLMGDHLALEQESFGGKKGTNKVKRMRDGERAAAMPLRAAASAPHLRHRTACAATAAE